MLCLVLLQGDDVPHATADWIIEEPMRAIGVVPHDGQGRVPLTSFVAALEDAHRKAPSGFAWRLGLGFDLDQLGALGAGIASATRLGDALGLLAKGFPLIQTGAETRLDADSDRAVFRYRLYDGRIWPRAGDAELTLGLAAGILSRFGVSACDGVTVQIEHGPDSRLAGLVDCVGRPVITSARANGLILPVSLLDRTRSDPPSQTSKPDLARLLCQHDRKMSLPLRVRAEAYRSLTHGKTSQDGVARSLGLSERTLRRRMGSEPLGYREVLDDCRHALAVSMFREGSRSLAEIALALGYSDQAAFTRAAHRWFGEAPGAARQRVREHQHSGRK